MGLETGTYISDLNVANPTSSDPKSQGDDHIRLLKATVKATFPNVSGAVTPTHTELNYVDGVTSAIQTQIDAKGAIAGQAWTGNHTFPTQTAGNNSTKAATTAYVDTADALKANLASPALTGTPTAPTAAPGTNNTQVATTAFATALALSAALPAQTGNSGKFLTTDGSNASWSSLTNLKNAQSSNYTLLAADRYKHLVLTSSGTLTLLAAATAGDGYFFWLRNDGTGVWTVDPNSAETIDGRTTIKVYPGESFAVICDGSNWRCFGRSRGPVLISTTTIGVAVSEVDFEAGFDDTEFASFRLVGESLSTASSDTIQVRVKKGGAYITSTYFSRTGDGTLVGPSSSLSVASTSGAANAASLVLEVVAPAGSPNMIHAVSANYDNGGSGFNGGDDMNGFQTTATAMQGLRVFGNVSNLDAGTLRFYGVR